MNKIDPQSESLDILIIDKDLNLLQKYKSNFEEHKYKTSIADNNTLAMEIIIMNDPKVIIMDVEETGIGNWTEEQFVKAVKFGIVPNGPALRNPMIPYAQLTDEEAKAIYAYLRTVPKIKHAISRGI